MQRTKRIDLVSLLDEHIYFPMQSLDPVGEWAASILLNHVFQRNKHYGTRRLTTAASVDESIGLVSKAHAASGISGTNALATLATMNREFGLWLQFSTVDLTETDPLILSTAASIAILPGVHERSLRLAGLTPAQANTAKHMRLGQVMFLYPGRLAWPVMARYNALPEGLKERRPSPKAVAAPEPAPSPVVELHFDESVLPAVGRIVREVLDKPPDTPVFADPRPDGEPVLANDKLRLLRYVGENGVVTTAKTFDDCGVHRDRGSEIKNEAIALGYLVAEKIVVHGGRGGTAHGMALTSLGYRRIGMEPPRRTKGGGLQSEYLCQQFLRLIPRSRLEPALDLADADHHKQPDLLVRIDHALHQPLLDALQNESLSWMNREYVVPDGGLLAVEVECGDASNVARSVRSNLERDRAAGLKHIVFAVMPAQLHRVLPVIRADGDPNIIAVDAIKLLDMLRKERRTA